MRRPAPEALSLRCPRWHPPGSWRRSEPWRDGAVVVVELHRPETLNAFNVRMAQELHAVLGDIAGDKSARAVMLTGSGRGFSSGFDLIDGGMPTLPSGRPDARRTLLEVFNPLVLMLRELPQPVVAALNGVAAGIGLSYALACDIVVAARSATLLLAFVNVGLVPDGGATGAGAGPGRNWPRPRAVAARRSDQRRTRIGVGPGEPCRER